MLKIEPITAESLKRSADTTPAQVTASITCCIGGSFLTCDGIEDENGEKGISAVGKDARAALAALLKKIKAEGWKDYQTSSETGWACSSCLQSYIDADKEDAL